MRVGFIGLGAMGLPMAGKLTAAGYDVTGFDVGEDAARAATDHGIIPAASAAAAAEGAETVVTMLPGPPEIEETMLGPQGALNGMGQQASWIDMSTSSASVSQRVRRDPRWRKRTLLDAPVTGGVTGARDGRLRIFVGSDEPPDERHSALLEAMGGPDSVVHVGPTGAGYSVKLCMQLLFFTHVAAAAEALTLGTSAGVPLRTLHRELTAGVAGSTALAKDIPHIFEGDYRDAFRLRLACKDISLAMDLARQQGVPAEVCGLAEQIHIRARAQYHDGGQLLAVKLLEDAAGIPLRTPEEAE